MTDTPTLINTDFRDVITDGGAIPYPDAGTTTPLSRDDTPNAPRGVFGQIQQSVEAMMKGTEQAKDTQQEVTGAKQEKASSESSHTPPGSSKSSHNIFEKIAMKLLHMDPSGTGEEKPATSSLNKKEPQPENPDIKHKDLRHQVQYLLNLPDEEYSDKKLTSKLRSYIKTADDEYNKTITTYKSHLAPSYRQHGPRTFNISGLMGKTYYTNSYPSYMDTLWTRDILDFHGKWDLSFYLYPSDDSKIQSMLKRRATQLKAEINEAARKGQTMDTELQLQYQDVDTIRQKLATHEERYFETGMYLSLYDEDEEKLKENGRKLEQKVSGLGLRIKPSTMRMDEGFESNLPLAIDNLGITRSTITSSLSGSFPFISQDIIHDTGILYGVNLHTGGLVIFDRFRKGLPNMNSVVLATSGAGKSFTVKLEILRYLLMGIDIIVIDPENEYKSLIDKVGGTYINIATNSQQYINPFDLPPAIEDVDYGEGDILRSHIMNILGLMKILVGEMSAQEEAILDKALQNVYALKGINFSTTDYSDKQAPMMEDLLQVLQGMEGGEDLSLKISKYVTGTFGKIFNNETNVDLSSQLTVFSIRDLEDALKTPAMFNVLNYIWTKIRSHKKPRLIICDEAWIMLQHDISANFLFGLTKRARKYGAGITTISQDIEDLVRSPYGKPIISNSAMQILLKQSTSSIKSLSEIIGLSESEKQRLVSSNIGEGLIFTGDHHVAIKILASPEEEQFITTDVGPS